MSDDISVNRKHSEPPKAVTPLVDCEHVHIVGMIGSQRSRPRLPAEISSVRPARASHVRHHHSMTNARRGEPRWVTNSRRTLRVGVVLLAAITASTATSCSWPGGAPDHHQTSGRSVPRTPAPLRTSQPRTSRPSARPTAKAADVRTNLFVSPSGNIYCGVFLTGFSVPQPGRAAKMACFIVHHDYPPADCINHGEGSYTDVLGRHGPAAVYPCSGDLLTALYGNHPSS